MKTEKKKRFFFSKKKNRYLLVIALAYSNPERVFFPGSFSDLPRSLAANWSRSLFNSFRCQNHLPPPRLFTLHKKSSGRQESAPRAIPVNAGS